MNYLNLCNAVAHRLNEVPMTTANFATAAGFHAQIKDAVQFAVRDIYHAEYEWPFTHSATTVTLTSGTAIYGLASAAPSFVRVDWESFRLNKAIPDSTVVAYHIPYMDYDVWRQTRQATDANMSASAYTDPDFVFKTQHEEFGVTPPPDKNYSITFEYWVSPADLSASTDTPAIYDRFDHVIIDGAMWYCYMFRENVEAAAGMEKKFKDGIRRMRVDLINRFDAFRSDYVGGQNLYGTIARTF